MLALKKHVQILFLLLILIFIHLATSKCENQKDFDELNQQVKDQKIEILALKSCTDVLYKKHGYFVASKNLNYFHAEELCKKFDSHLPYKRAKTLTDRNKIAKMLANKDWSNINGTFWIGLKKGNEGKFLWLNDEAVDNTKVGWMNGEPNNAKNDENCVHTNFNKNANHEINDEKCNMMFTVVCEKKC